MTQALKKTHQVSRDTVLTEKCAILARICQLIRMIMIIYSMTSHQQRLSSMNVLALVRTCNTVKTFKINKACKMIVSSNSNKLTMSKFRVRLKKAILMHNIML